MRKIMVGAFLASRLTRYAALALVAAAAFAPGADAQTLKVVIPQKGAFDTSIVDFGVRQGFFKEQGLDIERFSARAAPTTSRR